MLYYTTFLIKKSAILSQDTNLFFNIFLSFIQPNISLKNKNFSKPKLFKFWSSPSITYEKCRKYNQVTL